MTAFIAVCTWYTGAADSPLQSRYLLPAALDALVLRRGQRLARIATIATVWGAGAALRSGLDPLSAAYAGRLLALIGPLAIVAWPTTELGTAVRDAGRRAAALSDYDPLTGLVDRHPFLKAVRDELASGRSAGRSCATPIFDVEGLRHLNEQSGYEAGNATLQLVAEALKRVLRESDIAARWGGDEFAVLLPATDLGTAPAVGQRLRGAVHAATLEIAGRHLRGSVSVGCACAPRDGRSGETLLASGERRLERDRELRRDAPGVAASA